MILDSHLVLTREEIGDELEKLIIPNPVYETNERLGFSNAGVPRTLKLYKEMPDGTIRVPRNATPLNIGHLFKNVEDRRSKGFPIDVKSRIQLYDYQKPAVEAMMKTGDGILQAGTGRGKSIMACEIIARFGRTALILVHKEFLMDQFMEHLQKGLGLTKDEIGIVRGNPKNWTWKGRKVVIGMLQSIYAHRDKLTEEFLRYFGLVVSDECHRVSASTWSEVIQLFPCWKRLGLTATPKRADGLEIIFFQHLGGIKYTIPGVNVKPTVHIVRTNATTDELGKITWRGKVHLSKLITELTKHEERNKKILQLLVSAAKAGRTIIVLSDRRDHVELLKKSFDYNKEALGLGDVETRMYVGGMPKEERREAEENGDIFFATFQMAKEGLDIPRLDTLFLTTPNSSHITVQQSIGRITRVDEGKKQPMVVDFLDRYIGICNSLFNKRMQVYNKMGLEVK